MKYVRRLIFWGLTMAGTLVQAQDVAIAIHGGAGTILREQMSPELERAYLDQLRNAVTAGHQVLVQGGSSLEAVQAAIVLMEDSPLFNAGHGAVMNHDGKVELDASLMSGHNREAGAVASIRHIKNPILLANAVLQHSPHVMLVGDGAEQFAARYDLETVDNQYFYTERRQQQLKRVQSMDLTTLSESEYLEDHKLGTVGAVALDAAGNLAAGTSTGGMTNKRFGRVGDSPIIGAGTYADNRSCAISATGHGEFFIRLAVAHEICAQVRMAGKTLQQAADDVIKSELNAMGADGGVVGVDPSGDIVFSFNSAGMYRAAIGTDGKLVLGIYESNEPMMTTP